MAMFKKIKVLGSAIRIGAESTQVCETFRQCKARSANAAGANFVSHYPLPLHLMWSHSVHVGVLPREEELAEWDCKRKCKICCNDNFGKGHNFNHKENCHCKQQCGLESSHTQECSGKE